MIRCLSLLHDRPSPNALALILLDSKQYSPPPKGSGNGSWFLAASALEVGGDQWASTKPSGQP